MLQIFDLESIEVIEIDKEVKSFGFKIFDLGSIKRSSR